MIYVCIPSYNEAPTVGLLLWKIRQVFAAFPREYRQAGLRKLRELESQKDNYALAVDELARVISELERLSDATLIFRTMSAIGMTRRSGVWPHFLGNS